MGQPKAFLPAGPGHTFLSRLAGVLRAGGITDLLVVGRPEDAALRIAVQALGPGVRYVENPHADAGQISSIVAAVGVADRPGVLGLLVVPVDQPLLKVATIQTLLGAFRRMQPLVARATHGGRHGHPVVFGASVFEELCRVDPAIGARAVLRAHADAILDVEVDDEGTLIDVDDPATYERLFGSRLE